jgi:hypothetical protein
MRSTFAVVAIVGAVTLSMAASQTPKMTKLEAWGVQTYRELRKYEQELKLGDMTHQVYMSTLEKDRNKSVDIEMEGGTDYVVLGVCDNDCPDLDLTLYDENGKQVSEDVQTDAFPVVQASPRNNATYRVKATMANCTANPCWFAISVYKK